jgi:uncharacterized membrane protein YdjX (TVP38/TMEM64 family)
MELATLTFADELQCVTRLSQPETLRRLPPMDRKPNLKLNRVPGCHAGRPRLLGAALSGETPPSSSRRAWIRVVPLALLLAAVAVVLTLGWHQALTLESVVALRDRFHGILAEHCVAAVAAYIAAYALLAALSLPGCPIVTAMGGLMFGSLIGGAAAVVGASIGATLLFVIARSAVGGMLSERATPWLVKLRKGFAEDALSYLLFLRLVPAFPFWFVNIAPAVLGVPLKTYVIATFFGIMPATFAFASAGAGLDSVIMAAKHEYAQCVAQAYAEACRLKIHASSLVTRQLVLALLLLGIVALIPVILRKRRNNHAAAK